MVNTSPKSQLVEYKLCQQVREIKDKDQDESYSPYVTKRGHNYSRLKLQALWLPETSSYQTFWSSIQMLTCMWTKSQVTEW